MEDLDPGACESVLMNDRTGLNSFLIGSNGGVICCTHNVRYEEFVEDMSFFQDLSTHDFPEGLRLTVNR